MQEVGLVQDPGLLLEPGPVLEPGMGLGLGLGLELLLGRLLEPLPVLGSGMEWQPGLVQRQEEELIKEIEERGGMPPNHGVSGPRRRRTT